MSDKNKNKREKEKELIEALLFISGRFLSIGEISKISEIGEEEAKEILNELSSKYSELDGALQLVVRHDNYKMDVRQEYAYLINKLISGESEFTKAEQETLAVIAFKKPIKQSVVVRIRGNKAYEHVKKFVSLGLVNSKRDGRTFLLDLSENFYNYFNITEKGLGLKDVGEIKETK